MNQQILDTYTKLQQKDAFLNAAVRLAHLRGDHQKATLLAKELNDVRIQANILISNYVDGYKVPTPERKPIITPALDVAFPAKKSPPSTLAGKRAQQKIARSKVGK